MIRVVILMYLAQQKDRDSRRRIFMKRRRDLREASIHLRYLNLCKYIAFYICGQIIHIYIVRHQSRPQCSLSVERVLS